MDRRPIWHMPMIYRVWASRRSRDWAKWRLTWEGETDFRGADTLAWDVALAMEAAETNGDEFGLLALDWRKAYDGIDLQTLGHTLERAKVPDWARKPLMYMYCRNRRKRVGTVIGEEWEPSCGVMAGCGIAVFALAVCTRPWAVTAGLIPHLHRRLYVDDSTAWCMGKQSK